MAIRAYPLWLLWCLLLKITTLQMCVAPCSLQNSSPAFISLDSQNSSVRWGHQPTLKKNTKVLPSSGVLSTQQKKTLV